MIENRSIQFFEEQFQRQRNDAASLRLNPFEQLTLPYLRGSVLDVGCGLGNLAFAAAHQGCRVVAVDGSPAAIDHVRARAAAENADVVPVLADLREFAPQHDFDCIVSIGLLMFFDCATALRILSQIQARVRPGGIAAINVLTEGTTYLGMFDPAGYCLLSESELTQRFAGWEVEQVASSEFPAPQDTVKRFCTVIARKS